MLKSFAEVTSAQMPQMPLMQKGYIISKDVPMFLCKQFLSGLG